MKNNRTFINEVNNCSTVIGGELMGEKKIPFAEEANLGEPQAIVEVPEVKPVKIRNTVLGSRGGGMYAKLETYLKGLNGNAEITKKEIETELGSHSGYVQMCIGQAVKSGLIIKIGKSKFKINACT